MKVNMDVHPAFNVIVGQNGMGKTNLLDAVYYLCMCRSYLQHQDRNVVNFDKDAFRLVGNFISQKEKHFKVVAKVAAGKSKKIECNSKEYKKLSDHIGKMPVIFITPDDIQALKEGSEERRKLLDTCISQYNKNYLEGLMNYGRALKQRNAYLKSLEGHSADPVMIQSLDQQLIGPAQVIYEGRQSFLTDFNPIFNNAYQILSGGNESMECKLKSQMEMQPLDELLHQALQKDLILQRTTVGPHKDDLKISMNGRAMKTFASQGQIKSGILSIKLAQYMLLSEYTEQKPILLLDDIFDKLDRSRVDQLMQYIINNNFGQTFISDTHPNRVSDILSKYSKEFYKFTVADNSVNNISQSE